MKTPQSKSTKLDDANNFMREFSEWFDKPKGNLSHKEGWKYYHARLEALIESKVLEGRKDEVRHEIHFLLHDFKLTDNYDLKMAANRLEIRLEELEATPKRIEK